MHMNIRLSMKQSLGQHPENMKTFFCLLIVLIATFTAAAQNSVEAMLNFDGPSSNDGVFLTPISSSVNRSFGWTFQPLTDIDVTALGAFDYIVPPTGVLDVGLWDATGTLLASGTVSAASPSVNQSLYESITPVMLTAGQTYYLAAYSAAPFQFYDAGPDANPSYGNVTMSPEIQLGAVAYSPNAGFAFPSTTEGSHDDAIIAPNFQFEAVPEPSTFYLLSGGSIILLAMWRRQVNLPAADA
jgi:Domain of unknown function (DUF4082)